MNTRFESALSLCAGWLFLLAPAHAEQERPLVARPDRHAKWEVVFRIQASEPSADGKVTEEEFQPATPKALKDTVALAKTDYEIAGPVGVSVQHFSDGSQRDIWVFEKHGMILRRSVKGRLYSERLGEATSPELLFFRAYPFLDWLRRKHYVGRVEVFGTECDYFRADLNAGSDDGGPHIVEAWIAAETRLPIAVRGPEGAKRFFHKPASGGPLTPPPDVMAALRDRTTRPPRTP